MKGIRVLTYDWKYVSRTEISTVKEQEKYSQRGFQWHRGYLRTRDSRRDVVAVTIEYRLSSFCPPQAWLLHRFVGDNSTMSTAKSNNVHLTQHTIEPVVPRR